MGTVVVNSKTKQHGQGHHFFCPGASYQKSETQDQYGVVGGSYTVALPDGRTQIVTYTADHEGGFIADVKYEGVAQYPPEPKEGYGHAPPAYHPAPPPKYAPAPAKRQ